MKALFEQGEIYMAVGLEKNNKLSISFKDTGIELEYDEAVLLNQMIGRFVNEQEANIRKKLPWWRRFF